MPFYFKTGILRIYFELFLNKKKIEVEDIMFVLKECIIPEFHIGLVNKMLEYKQNDIVKDRLLLKSNEYW